jgi:hypothetical protein
MTLIQAGFGDDQLLDLGCLTFLHHICMIMWLAIGRKTHWRVHSLPTNNHIWASVSMGWSSIPQKSHTRFWLVWFQDTRIQSEEATRVKLGHLIVNWDKQNICCYDKFWELNLCYLSTSETRSWRIPQHLGVFMTQWACIPLSAPKMLQCEPTMCNNFCFVREVGTESACLWFVWRRRFWDWWKKSQHFLPNAYQVCFSQKNISFLAKQVASDTLQYVLASVTQYYMLVDISFHGK